jgi:hypothetical protein
MRLCQFSSEIQLLARRSRPKSKAISAAESQSRVDLFSYRLKSLPKSLIYELLPDISAAQTPHPPMGGIPSELVAWLDCRRDSPFHGLVRKTADVKNFKGVIVDTALITNIRNSLNSPLGALSPYKGRAGTLPDLEGMYHQLVAFWRAARDTFPDAWGLPPTHSRLMHSAGIQAMGYLMDRLVARTQGSSDQPRALLQALQGIRHNCAWTNGGWEGLDLAWDEVQSVPRHIRGLADLLIKLDYEASQGRTAWIYELLPTVEGGLPKRLSDRSTAVNLTARLNNDPDSSLRGLIHHPTNLAGILSDTAIERVILNSLSDGALRFTARRQGFDRCFGLISDYFGAVQYVSQDEWKDHKPRTSRLVHGAGIFAMGYVMEELHRRGAETTDGFRRGLGCLVGRTAWTSGEWDFGGGDRRNWKAVHYTNRDIVTLAQHLVGIVREDARTQLGQKTDENNAPSD